MVVVTSMLLPTSETRGGRGSARQRLRRQARPRCMRRKRRGARRTRRGARRRRCVGGSSGAWFGRKACVCEIFLGGRHCVRSRSFAQYTTKRHLRSRRRTRSSRTSAPRCSRCAAGRRSAPGRTPRSASTGTDPKQQLQNSNQPGYPKQPLKVQTHERVPETNPVARAARGATAEGETIWRQLQGLQGGARPGRPGPPARQCADRPALRPRVVGVLSHRVYSSLVPLSADRFRVLGVF